MCPGEGPIRLVLVDDHPMVRKGLAVFLAGEGFEVVAAEADGRRGMEAASTCDVDLLVIDLTLEQGSGLDVLRAATRLHPTLRAIVYSVHEDGDKVRQAMQAGAMGYVTKREDPEVLLDALRQVHSGHRFLSPRASRAIADDVAGQPLVDPKNLLSSQEMGVFVLIGRGNAPQDIAEQMHLSVRTVETYISRILDKLAISGRRDLRILATEWLRREGSV